MAIRLKNTNFRYSETRLSPRNPKFFNISMFYRVRFDQTELYFIPFECSNMMYLNNFRTNSIRKIEGKF